MNVSYWQHKLAEMIAEAQSDGCEFVFNSGSWEFCIYDPDEVTDKHMEFERVIW